MTPHVLIPVLVLFPAGVFALLGVAWLIGWTPGERCVAWWTAACSLTGVAAVTGLGAHLLRSGEEAVTARLGDWFTAGSHHFPLTLMVDRTSLPFVALSVVLVGVVAAFSVRYLHREPGFLRFFALLHLFTFGILLLFTAASFDLLIGGWELVGVTSVFLIAYFRHREAPARNALRVFATYRLCDIGLLTGVVLIHRYAGDAALADLGGTPWSELAGPLGGSAATTVGLLLLLAAMGKAAQVPFSGWLPRAMEGPTPSSAIFYGALSVHAGAYLMLRARPIVAESPLATAALVAVGLLTALHGTLAGRASTDAKGALAHASMTQLGLIFAEIGLGWTTLATLHVCGHAAVRTLEFLRAPSALHDYHRLHSAAGGALRRTGAVYPRLLPETARAWLYRLALDGASLDTLLARFLVNPSLNASRWVRARQARRLEGSPAAVSRRLAEERSDG